MKSMGLLFCLTVMMLGSSPTSARSSKIAQARKLFKAGQEAYAKGEYLEAARTFDKGYALYSKPGFLINIAQSYRMARKLEKALEYYEEYLRVARDARLKPQVEGLITEIKAEIDQQKKARQRRAARKKARPAPAAAVAVTPPKRPPPKEKKIYQQWWFWAGVAAVVGTGVGVGIWAGTREPDYVKEGGLGSVTW